MIKLPRKAKGKLKRTQGNKTEVKEGSGWIVDWKLQDNGVVKPLGLERSLGGWYWAENGYTEVLEYTITEYIEVDLDQEEKIFIEYYDGGFNYTRNVLVATTGERIRIVKDNHLCIANVKEHAIELDEGKVALIGKEGDIWALRTLFLPAFTLIYV